MQRQVEGTVQNIIRPFLKKSSTFAVHANLNTKQLSRQLVWEPGKGLARQTTRHFYSRHVTIRAIFIISVCMGAPKTADYSMRTPSAFRVDSLLKLKGCWKELLVLRRRRILRPGRIIRLCYWVVSHPVKHKIRVKRWRVRRQSKRTKRELL